MLTADRVREVGDEPSFSVRPEKNNGKKIVLMVIYKCVVFATYSVCDCSALGAGDLDLSCVPQFGFACFSVARIRPSHRSCPSFAKSFGVEQATRNDLILPS